MATLEQILAGTRGDDAGGGPGSGIGAEWSPGSYNYRMAGLNMGGLNMGYGVNGFNLGATPNPYWDIDPRHAQWEAAQRGGAAAAGAANPYWDIDSRHAAFQAAQMAQGMQNPALQLANTPTYEQHMQNAKMAALANRAASNSIMVSASLPTERRLQPLGFGQIGTIASGVVALFTIQPLVLAKPKRLIVDRALYGQYFNFTIQQVNQKSQMVNGNAVPASTYAENSTYSAIDWDPCQPQGVILLAVQNIDPAAAAHAFFGTLICEVAV